MIGNFFKSLGARSKSITLLSPIAGKVIPLSEVKDPTFANGLLGAGIAIEPSSDRVVAPADARVEAIFPTGYAVALHTEDGLDILIHVGLNTIQLEGKHFKVHATEGDLVEKGQVLIEYDCAAVAAEGFDETVPILLCNSVEFTAIESEYGRTVDELEPLFTVHER